MASKQEYWWSAFQISVIAWALSEGTRRFELPFMVSYSESSVDTQGVNLCRLFSDVRIAAGLHHEVFSHQMSIPRRFPEVKR